MNRQGVGLLGFFISVRHTSTNFIWTSPCKVPSGVAHIQFIGRPDTKLLSRAGSAIPITSTHPLQRECLSSRATNTETQRCRGRTRSTMHSPDAQNVIPPFITSLKSLAVRGRARTAEKNSRGVQHERAHSFPTSHCAEKG